MALQEGKVPTYCQPDPQVHGYPTTRPISRCCTASRRRLFRRELLYLPRNVRAHRLYGMSPVRRWR